MAKSHFDEAAGAARGEVVGGGEGLRGENVPAPEIKGTGVFIGDKELSHEELASLKNTNPQLHATITGMRGQLAARSKAESGASKSSLAKAGLPMPGSDVPVAGSPSGGTKAPRAPKPPKEFGGLAPVMGTRRGGGQVPEHLPGRKLQGHLNYLHRNLSTIADTMASSSHPGLSALATVAQDHLNGGTEDAPGFHQHMAKANEAFAMMDTVRARKHLIAASDSVRKAVGVLATPDVQEIAKAHGFNSELPSLEDLDKARDTSRVKKQSNPFKKINIAGRVMDINDPEARKFRANAKLERGTAADAKVRDAERGTPRAPSKAVRRQPVEVVGESKPVPSTAKTVMGKASKTRRPTSVKSDANKNVPSIMGKPEIGPDIGSQEQPELPKPTGASMAAPVAKPNPRIPGTEKGKKGSK